MIDGRRILFSMPNIHNSSEHSVFQTRMMAHEVLNAQAEVINRLTGRMLCGRL